MNARLTHVDAAILEIAEGARDDRNDADANTYAAIIAIKDAYRCDMAKAATLLAQARMAEAALKTITE